MNYSYGCFPESIRYLDVHPVFPDDTPQETKDAYNALFAPLLLNSALAALKNPSHANYNAAISATTRALKKLQLSDADKGK